MKRAQLLTALPFAVFFILGLALIIGLHHRGGEVSKFAKHIGDPAPTTDLPIMQGMGAHFTTASWRGRPYVVNFFASWCGDCKTEHEELMTLAHTVPLIGIAFKDREGNMSGYLNRAGNPFVAVAEDNDGHAGADWGLTDVPETFVIDDSGIIRWHHIGPLTDEVVSHELLPVWESVR